MAAALPLTTEFDMAADAADPSSAVPSGGADAAGPFCLETSLASTLNPAGPGFCPSAALEA
jgi:hypothetical protein